MNQNTKQIFANAFKYLVGQTKFYCALARENRSRPGVHTAQLAVARKNAIEARWFFKELKENA